MLDLKPIWFVVGMKYIASLSGGKDSVAMVLGLIEKKYPLDEVVYYDNGMDFKAIHDVVFNQVKPTLDQHNIKLVVLHPKHEFLWGMFERPVKYRDKPGYHYGWSWCGGAVRWGTTEKLGVLEKYSKGAIEYVGIASDETQRLIKNRSGNKCFPLAEWGWTEADCLSYCRSHGIHWTEHSSTGDIDLYDILDRVSCWCCANKNLKELRAIYQYLPEYWERLRQMQARLERPFKRYGTIFELEERFKKEQLRK